MSAASAQTLVQPEITPLEARASKYVEFRNDVQVVAATEVDSAMVSRDAHNRLASHTPEDLSSGWIAYAALVAADTPEFAAAIQSRMAKPRDKEAFLTELRNNPRIVRELAGAQQAVDAILMVSAQDAAYISQLGERYISRAYAMQNIGWAKQKLADDGTARLDEARSFAVTRARMATPVLPASLTGGVRKPGISDYDTTWRPGWSEISATPLKNPRAAPILDRALVLAARYAVGDVTEPIVEGYAKSENIRRCLFTAELNLDQCISATRSSTEEVFCLGKHGLSEVSGCVGWISNTGGIN